MEADRVLTTLEDSDGLAEIEKEDNSNQITGMSPFGGNNTNSTNNTTYIMNNKEQNITSTIEEEKFHRANFQLFLETTKAKLCY